MIKHSAILFLNFLDDSYLKDVFLSVRKKLDGAGDVLIATGWKENKEADSELFTDDLVREISLRNVISTEAKENADCINLINDQNAKSMFLRTIDRVFVKKESMELYDRYFQSLSVFWIHVLKCRKVRVLIFDSSPHMPWDIVAFYAARYLGLSTMILKRTIFNKLCLLVDDFRSGLTSIYEPSIKPVDDEQLHMLFSSKVTTFSRQVKKEFPENRYFNTIYLLIYFCLSVRVILAKTHPIDYFKLGRFERGYFSLVRLLNSRRYQKIYKDLAVFPNLNLRYVYFALHFRPERSTIPEGGFFYNQYIAIHHLRSNLDDEVLIYVKEHPRQYTETWPDLRRVHQAEGILYERLASLKNVFLVPSDSDTNALISNCILTGTITGSTAWEGLERGKPGVTYGNTWHSGCLSSPDISLTDNAKAIINFLLSKSSEEVRNDASVFLQELRAKLIFGVTSESFTKKSAVDYQELVDSMSDAIATQLTR